MWARPLFLKRAQYGAYPLLIAELRSCDTTGYRSFTRFTVDQFDELLTLYPLTRSDFDSFGHPPQAGFTGVSVAVQHATAVPLNSGS